MGTSTDEVCEIYALHCPDSGEIRYIGKARDSESRLKTHIRDSVSGTTPVRCWILWELKRALGDALRRGHLDDATKSKLRLAATKNPRLFGAWAAI